ncbi:hypothetical protein M569_03887, partial [Genlisea aurea]
DSVIGRFKWKQKLRENCLARVREDRARLLWKFRTPEAEESVKTTLQGIVSDELRKILCSSLDQSCIPAIDAAANDMIWEYDGLHTAHQVECEEVLLEMQKIFYEDLRSEENTRGSSLKTWEDDEDEYLARMVYEHMQLGTNQKEVWCPVCKKGELRESGDAIFCCLCELKLRKGHEVDLEFLRARLGEAHAEHFNGGCTLKPEFTTETRFGLTALYIKCKECNSLELVV